jgi:hypothetical protein
MNQDFPPFPAHALAPIQRQMAEATAEIISIPPELPYCCALDATSAACGRALMTPSGPGRKIGANIYHLLAAPSGLGKSSVFRPLFEPLQSFQSARYARFAEVGRPELVLEQTKLKYKFETYKKNLGKKDFIEGQDEMMKQIIARLDEIELELHPPQIICEDITSEALAVALAANREQLFSLSADADKVFRNAEGRYVRGKEIDEGLIVKCLSRDPHWAHRISRPPVYLESPCMTVCWMTQPLRLKRLFANQEFRDGGLLPRFLVVMRDPEIGEIPKDLPQVSEKLQNAYRDMILRLLNTFWDSRDEIVIPESPEVYEYLRCFYNKLVPRMNRSDYDIAIFLKRWTEFGWRISLVLHAALHGEQAADKPLALSTAESAIEIVEWHAGEQLRVLEPLRDTFVNESFQRLVTYLQRQSNGEATVRDLTRGLHFTKSELDKVLDVFSSRFSRHHKAPPKRGGPPSEIIRLLPTAYASATM